MKSNKRLIHIGILLVFFVGSSLFILHGFMHMQASTFQIQNTLDEISIKIENLPEPVRVKATNELDRLAHMGTGHHEYAQTKNYLDWLMKLPWNNSSHTHFDLKLAEQIFDQSHYGLKDIKDRIIESLLVQDRVNNPHAPILCLVGPPGVGKTSLVKTIAEVTNRKFVNLPLGGVRDEANIRGFMRTYMGASPGVIIKKIADAGVNNPLILLDEVDKLVGSNHSGDPAAALLEVLDPIQNTAFQDHYLEMGFDLSKILFIATANSLEDIPGPLRDRMEIIYVSSYTEQEKLNITKKHIAPKQREYNGLTDKDVMLEDEAIADMIRHYTYEAGVRNLTRVIDKVLRKVVRQIHDAPQNTPVVINSRNLSDFLGPRQVTYNRVLENPKVGIVNGLAWSPIGGSLLHIEAVAMPGKGGRILTGHLGKVMQESILAAISVARSQGHHYQVSPDFIKHTDIHVHVPSGAQPKDGPSAGIAMTTALISALSGKPIKSDLAMTGEITLRGEVLAIGGLKEKILGAHRAGIKTVVIPESNRKDLVKVPKTVLEEINIVPVKHISDVLTIALISK